MAGKMAHRFLLASEEDKTYLWITNFAQRTANFLQPLPKSIIIIKLITK